MSEINERIYDVSGCDVSGGFSDVSGGCDISGRRCDVSGASSPVCETLDKCDYEEESEFNNYFYTKSTVFSMRNAEGKTLQFTTFYDQGTEMVSIDASKEMTLSVASLKAYINEISKPSYEEPQEVPRENDDLHYALLLAVVAALISALFGGYMIYSSKHTF